MDSNKIKVALIGLGHLGKIHLKCIKQCPNFHLEGVWDIDKELQKNISLGEGLYDFESIDDLLDASEAVILVSPTSTHYDWAKTCIEKNKHVFIEKPVTSSTGEAETLYEILKDKNLKIQVGHVERFNPAFLSIKESLGSPMFIEGHRLAEFKPRGTDVSVVMDLMIHDLDLVLNMVKSPVKEVRASGVAIISPTPDICNARIEFENGAIANLTASRISIKQMRKLRVFQSGQYISMDLLKKETQLVKISDQAPVNHPFSWPVDTLNGTKHIQVEMPAPPQNNAIVDELTSFSDSIINNKETVVSFDDGLKALQLAQRIQDQIEPGKI